ncbi:DUF2314 domain-containing protein [Roseateles sp. BYS180W]|uniref:DUF2314 domain-containing protein n=1 Tax=Roseateles rivi TaxID=3299028 RepID=A0ABW7FRE3_9BURK
MIDCRPTHHSTGPARKAAQAGDFKRYASAMKFVAVSLAAAVFASLSVASDAASANPSASAQRALPKFLAAVHDKPDWASRFRVYVELGTGARREPFWLNDFREDADGYSGLVSSVPRVAEGVRLGQRVAVRPEQILDWTYEHPKTRKISGHFFLCAEWAALPVEQADEQKQYWGVSCDGQQ